MAFNSAEYKLVCMYLYIKMHQAGKKYVQMAH